MSAGDRACHRDRIARAGHCRAAGARLGDAKARQRLVLNPPAKIWNWLLDLTIGYGYRTWQAGLWLLGLMLAGAVVFAHAYPAGMIATSRHPMPFNAPVYTLDVLLPSTSASRTPGNRQESHSACTGRSSSSDGR